MPGSQPAEGPACPRCVEESCSGPSPGRESGCPGPGGVCGLTICVSGPDEIKFLLPKPVMDGGSKSPDASLAASHRSFLLALAPRGSAKRQHDQNRTEVTREESFVSFNRLVSPPWPPYLGTDIPVSP